MALPYIAGSLSASTDEATWVLTSYLVANAIVLPASNWFAMRIGRKRFFIICVAIFTASSFACGAAPTLGFILVARVLQGAGAGAPQPPRTEGPPAGRSRSALKLTYSDVSPCGADRRLSALTNMTCCAAIWIWESVRVILFAPIETGKILLDQERE